MRFKRYENKSLYIDFTIKDFKEVNSIFMKDMYEKQNVYIFPNNLNDEHLNGIKKLLNFRDRLQLHERLNIVIFYGKTQSVKKWIRLYLEGYNYKLVGGTFDGCINDKEYHILKQSQFIDITVRDKDSWLKNKTHVTITEEYTNNIECGSPCYKNAEKPLYYTMVEMEKAGFDKLSRIVYFYDILMQKRIEQLKEEKR